MPIFDAQTTMPRQPETITGPDGRIYTVFAREPARRLMQDGVVMFRHYAGSGWKPYPVAGLVDYPATEQDAAHFRIQDGHVQERNPRTGEWGSVVFITRGDALSDPGWRWTVVRNTTGKSVDSALRRPVNVKEHRPLAAIAKREKST